MGITADIDIDIDTSPDPVRISAPHLPKALDPPVGATQRPRTRSDCLGGARPCPWVSCKYHLYWLQNEDNRGRRGRVRHRVVDDDGTEYSSCCLPPWLMKETCLLDVTDRGGATLDEVGSILKLSRERVRQIEVAAIRKLHHIVAERKLGAKLREILDDVASIEPSAGSMIEQLATMMIGDDYSDDP